MTSAARAPEVISALEGGELDRAARLLEASALAMCDAGETASLGELLERLGAERVAASPVLSIAESRVARSRGEPDRVLASAERALELARARGDYDSAADAVRSCAPVLASRGEFARLLALLEETLRLPKLSESSTTALLMTLGAVYLDLERFDEALEMFKRIAPSVVSRGDLAVQGTLLHNTGVAHMRRGDPYAAIATYEHALAVKRGAGSRASAIFTMSNLIFARRVLGDLDEAERLTAAMLEDARSTGDAHLIAYALENEGGVKIARGDAAGARAAFAEALHLCDPSEVVVLPEIVTGLARCALASGEPVEAARACERAIAIHRAQGGRAQEIAAVLVTRAACESASGDFAAGAASLREAAVRAHEGPDTVLAASIALDVAAALLEIAPHLGAGAAEADALAARAATAAIELIHQRDHRFLLRTKAKAFERLESPLRRWRIGAGLLCEPDVAKPVARLRIEMLGGLRVAVGGESVRDDAWKRRKARDIFAHLVCLRGRGIARAKLVECYWPDTDAEAANDNLRVTISAIRKAVGDIVKFEENGYRFVAPPHTSVDVEHFDRFVERARAAAARGDAVDAHRAYVAATDLYRGDFLEGMEDGGWQWRERERVRAACLEALRWLAHDPASEPAARRLALERLLEIAPFDVEAVRMRLDGFAREMRLAEALREYEAWRQRYELAVGVEAPPVWSLPGSAAAPGRPGPIPNRSSIAAQEVIRPE